jgi:signal transduction histidine kinase/CheY-like chemotaxis protein
MFGLYDYTIRAAAMQNAALLEAKRRFVRFISHEVRTPLNSVIMGLKLLDVSVAEIMPNGEMDFEDLKSARVSDTQSRVSPTPRGSINSSTRSEDYSNIGPGKVGLDTSTVAEWLQLIHDINYNGQCAVDVLNDLLNYDKIEKGSLTLEKSVVSMWSLIERTTEEFTLQAKKAQVTITLDFCDLLPNCEGSKVCTPKLSRQAKGMADIVREEVKKLYVIGDVMRLAQVVRNLISNALKFTLENGNINVSAKWIAFQPPSSPQAGRSWKRSSRVHGHSNGPGLESEKDKSQKSQSIRGNMSTQDFSLVNKRNVRGSYKGILRLTVKDTGAGLSEEQLSELFGEGKQFNVNKLQSGQGSGLGLFITKGIVEQHGGKLTATSAGLGDGSAFTVELPLYFVSYLADDPEPTKDVEVGQAVSEDDYNVIKKLKILVVDDALSNRKILIRLLARWGHTCIEAANGQEAVEKYVKSEEQGDFIDVILMDSEMPVMSGPVAASKLRELGCILPIIGVSGNALPEDVKDFIQHGANEVLPKPVSMDDLIRAWRNNLHQFNEMRRQRELSKKSGVFSLKTRFSGKLGNGHESSKSRDSDKLSNFIMSTSRSNKMQRSPTSYSSYSKSGKNSDDRGVKARDSKVTLEPIRSESPQSSRQSKSSFLMKKCQVSPTQRMKKYAISVDSADHVEGDGQLDVELGKTKTDSSGYEMQSVINKPEDVEAGAIDANSFQIGMTDL